MRIIDKVHKGNLQISEDTAVTGILVGNADIHEARKLHVGGIMNGNIKVRSGAELSVSGILNGDIVDNGGKITITGTHNGVNV